MESLKRREKEEVQEKSESANVVDERSTINEGDVCSVIADDKVSDTWILDSGCSFHMCPERKYFDTYRACDASTVMMGNGSASRVVGIGIVKMKMFDGVVRILANAKHVPMLRRWLTFSESACTLGCDVSVKNCTRTWCEVSRIRRWWTRPMLQTRAT